jgi:hypothetical protein
MGLSRRSGVTSPSCFSGKSGHTAHILRIEGIPQPWVSGASRRFAARRRVGQETPPLPLSVKGATYYTTFLGRGGEEVQEEGRNLFSWQRAWCGGCVSTLTILLPPPCGKGGQRGEGVRLEKKRRLVENCRVLRGCGGCPHFSPRSGLPSCTGGGKIGVVRVVSYRDAPKTVCSCGITSLRLAAR